ncbi:RHS repeat-associated core domain-containing protein, partial [Salinisphaera sp.]|uniref:RHS repeat-associated core domain-containing protein n=1 Tax=Salinisphaera sp. TaxID=1914330 RepID=UPI002D76563E
GRLARLTGPAGAVTAYGYDDRGNLAQVIGPEGRVRRYHYDDPFDAHNLTGLSRGRMPAGYRPQPLAPPEAPALPDGLEPYTVAADDTGQTAHAHDVAYKAGDASDTAVEPPQPADLIRIATWAYDRHDRAVLSVHAHGADQTTLAFKPHRTVVDRAGQGPSIYHTATRHGVPIVTAIDGPGCAACGDHAVSYTYNRRLRLSRVRFADGSQTFYRYDGQGRLYRAGYRDAAGNAHLVAELSYQGDSERVTRIASPSVKPAGQRVIRIAYDDYHRPIRIIQAGYAPTPGGGWRPISRTLMDRRPEPADNTSAHPAGLEPYDPPTAYKLADGPGLTRDANGRITQRIAADGAITRLTYDAAGRLTRLVRHAETAAAETVTLAYDAAGHVIAITGPKGSVHASYDAAGRLTGVRNATGRLRIAYDTANRVTRRRWRDAQGQVTATRNYRYDATGVTITDGHGTTLAHRPAPGASQAAPAAARAVASAAASITRNPRGWIIAVTDPRGNTTRRGLDDFGRWLFTASPDAGLTTYRYDANGRLRHKTRPGHARADFAYGPAGRPAQVAVAGGPRYRFAWTPAGRLAGIWSPTHDETRQYGPHGRVTAHSRRIGDRRYTTHYAYNAAGRISRVTRADGTTLDYHYRPDGALAGIGRAGWLGAETPIVSALDDSAGANEAVRAWRFGNGLATTRRFDANGRLRSLHIGALHTFVYHRDAAGRVIGVDDHGAISRRYRFDAHGRLDFALTPWALYGYRYDANGNRTQRVINGRHIGLIYADDSNRLQRIAALRPGWHAPLKAAPRAVAFAPGAAPTPAVSVHTQAGGQISQLGGLRITYNANGQPAALYRGGRRIATYQYNSRAQRITKTVYPADGRQAHTTHYLYTHGRLTAEANGQGEITRNYVYWHNRPVAILQNDTIYAVHTGRRGAPIAVTDAEQTVVWQAHYAPFGQAFVDHDPDGDGTAFILNLRLPGQYADAESGLYYNHHRYYNPATGRYISSDPMGIAAGLNTYAYVKNDPINNVDPLGLLLFAFDGTSNADTDPNVSNVVKFRDAYRADIGEPTTPSAGLYGAHWYYITGAGRDDPRSGLNAGYGQPDIKNFDLAYGNKTGERVLIMASRFFNYLNKLNSLSQRGALSTDHLNIDMIGFSRGAGEARIFANLLDQFLHGAESFIVTNGIADVAVDFNDSPIASQARQFLNRSCFHVNLRYLGLWDTVPHIGTAEVNDSIESAGSHGDAYLGIPGSIDFTAQAVAVDERRGIFDAWSIYDTPSQKINQAGKKLEKGFIGDHTDIGGAGDGDLSDIALNWIIEQGVEYTSMRQPELPDKYKKVTNPLVNDNVYDPIVFGAGRLYQPGREFRYLDYDEDTDVKQKEYRVPDGVDDDLDFQRSLNFIEKNIYTDTLTPILGDDHQHHTTLKKVDGEYKYRIWLKKHYGLDIDIDDSNLDRKILD